MRRREFIGLITSTTVVWPLAAPGAAAKESPDSRHHVAWRQRCRRGNIPHADPTLGYVEGRNVILVNTFAGEQYGRFTNNAAELVRRGVDVIVAVTLAAALAAQRATNTIPIVFIVVLDPVATKLVASLAHLGGNITGLSTVAADMLSKRVELFKEIVGPLSEIALMVNPSNPITTEDNIKQVRIAAERLDINVQVIEAAQPDQIERAFSSLQHGVNGVMILDDSLFFNERKRIAALALERMLPTAVFTSPTPRPLPC